MTISVTSLGTGNTYGGTSFSISGVTVSQGDWVVVAVASDIEPTNGIYVRVDDTTYLKEVAQVTNSGNTIVTVFAGRMLFGATSSSIFIQTSDTAAGVAYKVTNLGNATAAWLDISSSASTSTRDLYSGGTTREGNAAYFATDTITSVTFNINKTGSPTGTLYCRAYNIATDTLLHTFGSMDVSTLTTTLTDYTFNSASYSPPGNTPVAIVIEYTGGDASNCVGVRAGYLSEYPYNNVANTNYDGSWNYQALIPARLALAGAKIEAATDKTASATGTSGTPSSGATGTLAQAAEFVLGVTGMEHKLTESTGSWTNPTTYTQIDGTSANGSAANQVIRSAAKVVSSTTSQTAEIFGEDSADWAALCVTFMEYTAPAPTFKQSRALLGVGW